MSNTRKVVAEHNYIEFGYLIADLFNLVKSRCSTYVLGLGVEGKVKNPISFIITDDNVDFYNASGESAMFNAYNTLSSLSREIVNIIPTAVFDAVEGKVTLRVGYKSTIDSAVISAWESAIRDVMVSYVLKDWYQLFGLPSVDNYPEKYKTLFDISMTRYKSDLAWLLPDSVETARLNLEVAFREYLDEYIVLK